MDATNDAELWAAKERPRELHINHGEFIMDGMDHLKNELSRKKTSNRALLSLISQQHISKSEDEPIPSFMIMQCNILNETLYCTSYFRALETRRFLRINLEELRLKICEIHQAVPDFKEVRLVIVAFRAYANENINPLKIARIDLLEQVDIFHMLASERHNIANLLFEKANSSTVVITTSLDHIIVSLDRLTNGNHCNKVDFMIEHVNSLAISARNAAKELMVARRMHSHHEEIDRLDLEYKRAIEKLAQELSK